MKFYYFIPLILLFVLKGSQSPNLRDFDPTKLSGNVSLTLKHGVWKLWEHQPIYQDITLDLICDRGRCQPEVWGYAPKFNPDVDHQGTVKVIQSDNTWRFNVKMNIQDNPWNTETKEGDYEMEVISHKGKLLGSYSGKFNNRFLQGKIRGEIKPLPYVILPNHRPINPREHPRLIFRKEQIQDLQNKAKTPAGKAILAQLKKTLSDKVYYEAYVPNGGYHAAGYCLLALLNQDKQAAENAWKLVDNSMKRPGKRLLEHSPIVAGVALAYDLCYNNWSKDRIQKVTNWLGIQTDLLIKGDSIRKGWNSNPWSNWYGRAKGAAGLAALAILDEPPEFFTQPIDSQKLYQIAQRSVQRYFSTAIGDRGWGTEGDFYTTEPLVISVFPFLQANKNVMGKDLVKASNAQWILPHYLTRIVSQDGKLGVATYGRHRNYIGASLFTVGLGTLPEQFLPSVMGFFEQNLGMKGDKSFGISSPYLAGYALAGYREDIVTKNPAESLERVLVDKEKGFYVFRNRWQDSQDFVVSIYLKQKPLGASWSFPEVGSFRIWGLGGRWANPGSSEGKWEEENVVIVPKIRAWNLSKPTFFLANSQGSGVVSLRTDNRVIEKGNSPVKISLLRSLAVDYSGASGSPGLFVVVDKFIGSVNDENFQGKTWIMHTEGKAIIEKQSFTIQAANGATIKGTFITPSPVKITFQQRGNGGIIRATGGNEFFLVMTVQKGTPPAVKISGIGLDSLIRIGKQTINFGSGRIFLGVF
jgi:hypothetical protein